MVRRVQLLLLCAQHSTLPIPTDLRAPEAGHRDMHAALRAGGILAVYLLGQARNMFPCADSAGICAGESSPRQGCHSGETGRE